ncbi:hypothetical protein ASPBRDRAFT_606772 [Aspergillus brasiliensis CBS 101740]|uniref:Uncharacterized protein n=1 Tax=Aspergillus brasiliensis (strain CBS 101740 / IMI 381727 / IBT 21946) TaxID=767769 RepID=A0A1L9UHV5_ASPBC|nr:hypothetical protein ASPBRDRAFT_606772 [Aspergillus brasiliensis CBS 101740]
MDDSGSIPCMLLREEMQTVRSRSLNTLSTSPNLIIQTTPRICPGSEDATEADQGTVGSSRVSREESAHPRYCGPLNNHQGTTSPPGRNLKKEDSNI